MTCYVHYSVPANYSDGEHYFFTQCSLFQSDFNSLYNVMNLIEAVTFVFSGLLTGVRHQHNDSIESILRNEALYLITTISPERHFVRLLHSASTDNYPFNNSEEFKREQLSTWLRRKQESSTQNDSHKRPTTLFESILSFGSAETPPMPERYLYGALLNDKWRIHGSDKRFHESRPFRRRSVGEAGRMDLRVRRETVYEGSGVSYGMVL